MTSEELITQIIENQASKSDLISRYLEEACSAPEAQSPSEMPEKKRRRRRGRGKR